MTHRERIIRILLCHVTHPRLWPSADVIRLHCCPQPLSLFSATNGSKYPASLTLTTARRSERGRVPKGKQKKRHATRGEFARWLKAGGSQWWGSRIVSGVLVKMTAAYYELQHRDDAPEHKLTAGEGRGQHRGITGRKCSWWQIPLNVYISLRVTTPGEMQSAVQAPGKQNSLPAATPWSCDVSILLYSHKSTATLRLHKG